VKVAAFRARIAREKRAPDAREKFEAMVKAIFALKMYDRQHHRGEA
jgi:hypothetical protein